MADASRKGRLVQKLSLADMREILSNPDVDASHYADELGVSVVRVRHIRKKYGECAELPERAPLRLFVFTHGED